MKPFVDRDWMIHAESMAQVRRRLPDDAVVEARSHEGGGFSFSAMWTIPRGQRGAGVWQIIQPFMCLWVELRGPNGFRWTTQESKPGLDWWRILRVAEAVDAIVEER